MTLSSIATGIIIVGVTALVELLNKDLETEQKAFMEFE